MRASVLLLALALSGCSVSTRFILEPATYTGRTTFYHGPRHAFRVLTPHNVDSALHLRETEWGGIDRLTVVRASGKAFTLNPDSAGVRVQDGVLVVRSDGRTEALPLVGVARFAASDRRTPLQALGTAVVGTLGGALIGASVARISGDASWARIGRSAAAGAVVGTGVGVYRSAADRDAYEVYVGDFEAP